MLPCYRLGEDLTAESFRLCGCQRPKSTDAQIIGCKGTQPVNMGAHAQPAREGDAKGAGRVDYSAACGVPRPAASIATATDCTIAAKRTAV